MKPSQLLIKKFVYPNQPLNRVLDGWLYQLSNIGYNVQNTHFDFRVDLVRNREIGDFLDSNFDCLLMIDGDMVPIPETNNILTMPGDVLYCRHVSQLGKEIKIEEKGIPTGCIRIHRRVFEKIEEPWFYWNTDDKVRKTNFSEAYYFSKKLVNNGFKPISAGRIGHRIPLVGIPPTEGHVATDWHCEHVIMKQMGLS